MAELLLPLFPLEVVLLPEESLPLHIFEERYKQMVGECLAAAAGRFRQQEFGVVLAKDGRISETGCAARIVKVTRKYPDGRMDILIIGTRRFEILLTNEEKSYLRGTVDFFDDDFGADEAPPQEVEEAIGKFGEIMKRLKKPPEIPFQGLGPSKRLSFQLAAALPLGLDFKQSLLVMRNEAERLRLVVRFMEPLLSRLEYEEKARATAGGNGNIRT